MFIRINVLLCKFGKCTEDGTDTALCKYHNIRTNNRLRLVFNECIKVLLVFSRYYNVHRCGLNCVLYLLTLFCGAGHEKRMGEQLK